MSWCLLALDMPAEQLARDAIAKMSTDLGIVFLIFMCILGLIFYCVYRYSVLPTQRANLARAETERQNSEKLATAVAALCPMVATTMRTGEETRRNVHSIHRMMEAGVSALEKIDASKDGRVSLTYELGVMKGALGELETHVTDEPTEA